MAKQRCIRSITWRSAAVGGRRFTKGGKLNEAADDRCINANHPCAYFAKYKDEFIICMVPLPVALRKGKI
jgi:hypothetical protein